MESHEDLILFQQLFPKIREFQELASKHGIPDVFQDNGGKVFQTCLVLGLKVLGRREGNDAIDETGNEYELKSLNIKRSKAFSTNHHLSLKTIEKYRKVDWIFSIYEGIELKNIFLLTPTNLEYYYQKWTDKLLLENKIHLNNQSIPSGFVCKTGQLLWPK